MGKAEVFASVAGIIGLVADIITIFDKIQRQPATGEPYGGGGMTLFIFSMVYGSPVQEEDGQGGWLQYYGRYYRSALYPPMRQLDRLLARWAERKYKTLRGHLRRATHWVARISRRDPKLWAHWQMGERRGSMAGAV